MSKPVLIFLIIAVLAIVGIVALTVVEILNDRRRRAMVDTGDEDHGIDARLAHLETELATLHQQFNAAGLADYPGGPLTVHESADGHERQVRPSER